MRQVSEPRPQFAATVGGTEPREGQGAAQLRAEADLIKNAMATAATAVGNRIGVTTAWSRETTGWRAQGAVAAARLISEAEYAEHRDTEGDTHWEKSRGYGVLGVEKYEQVALEDYAPTESEYARTLDILGPFCAGQIPVYDDVDPAHGITGGLVADTYDWEAEASSFIKTEQPMKLDGLKANSSRISRDAWKMVAQIGTRALFVGYLPWTCPSGQLACCEVLGRALMGTITADYVGAVDGELVYAFQPWVDDVGAAMARLATTKPNELHALALSYATIAGAKRRAEGKGQGRGPRSREHRDGDGDLTMWTIRWTDGSGSPPLVHYRRAWRCRWGDATMSDLEWAFPSVFVFNDFSDMLADVQVREAMNSVLWTPSARNMGSTGALLRVYGDYIMATASPENDEQLAACARMFCAGALMYDALPRYSGAAEKTRVADYSKAATEPVVTINGTSGLSRSWKDEPVREVTWAEFTTNSERIRQRLRPYVKEETCRYIEGLLSVVRSAYNSMDDATMQRAMFELYTCGCELLPTEGENTVGWLLAETFHCWHIELRALVKWTHHVDSLLRIGANNDDGAVSQHCQ